MTAESTAKSMSPYQALGVFLPGGPACIAMALLLCGWTASFAQQIPVNYDESKVGEYTLPDALRLENGERVRDAAMWYRQRRPELVRLFEENVYGRSPVEGLDISWDVFDVENKAFGGRAVRKQVTVYFSKDKQGPREDVLMYLPSKARKPVPLIVTLNFTGNQSVIGDPAVKLGWIWDRSTKTKRQAGEESRGTNKDFAGAVEKLLARGYGMATIYYGDIEPDFSGGMSLGVRRIFLPPEQSEPAADEWGAIAAWGWGLSRALDYLETDHDVDAKRVAIMGHSRLGKTVLWAGARDARFAMVWASCSGEGGASLSRRNYGETVKHLNHNFPYQFSRNYLKFGDHVDQLPVDSHELIALMAPRYVYLSTAEQDQWADPKGEFLAAVAAGPVFQLLGRRGMDTDQMPAVNQPIIRDIGFHCHAGKHEVLSFDWDQFLRFADMHLH